MYPHLKNYNWKGKGTLSDLVLSIEIHLNHDYTPRLFEMNKIFKTNVFMLLGKTRLLLLGGKKPLHNGSGEQC